VLALVVVVQRRWTLKLWATVGLCGLTAAVPALFEIIRRPRIGLTVEHDGLLQVESAIDRVIAGQPIYGVDWSATPLGSLPWDLTPGGNPALHHLAYLPLTVLIGIPFRVASRALGWPFDYRTVLVAFVVVGLLAIVALPQTAERRIMLLATVFVSPLITLYLWSGRNDIEFLAMLLLCLALLSRARPVAAAGALGIALALKPFAWPAVPLLLLVLLLRWRRDHDRWKFLVSGLALAAPSVMTIVPFFMANPAAFYTDVVLYTSGGVPDAYPIAGYGFAELLYNAHLISHRSDAFPFALFQLAAMAPVLWLASRALLRRPTGQRWLAGYAGLLFAFCFFARFFNDNYAAVVITLFLCLPALDDEIGLAGIGARRDLQRAA
jgi:Glycosyltransferase family 87